MIRRFYLFYRNLFHREQMDRELEEELRSYVELVAEEKVRCGTDRDQAWRETHLDLGSFEPVKESIRDIRTGALMNTLLQDFRYALRFLARNPGFSAVALLALTLGIGPNTAIFSVVYANLLAPLPYPQSDQLVMVWSQIQGHRNVVSAGDFLDWQHQASSFQQIAAFTGQAYNLSLTQEPQYIQGERVSTNFYSLLGEKVWMGRDFRPEEDQPGKDHVFLLSHRCWVARFGADPHIIGKQFRLNGEPYTAIGVMPPGSSDRHNEEIWVPLRFIPEALNHQGRWLLVLGRLKSGVSIQQAQQQMNVVTQHLGELYPASNKGWSARVEPLQNDFQSPNVVRNLWLLLGAVSFVLLIACVDVASLLLARGTSRQREVAVRAALGASRRQLGLQFLTESLTLAGIGGILGILLSWMLLKVIAAMLPPGTLSSEADIRLNGPVLLFTLGITILSGLLFGSAPALQTKKVDLNDSLKQGGRSALSSGRHGLRQMLVVFQFASALTLLTGAALSVHSFVNRMRVDLGIQTDHLLTFFLPVPSSQLTQPQQTENFYRELLTRIEAVPGVKRAAAATGTPLQGTYFHLPFSVVGQPMTDPSSRPSMGFQMVTPSYFEALGAHVDRGRAFSPQDTSKSPRVAMVNETFVKRFLHGMDPLTQRLSVEPFGSGFNRFQTALEWQIVGVFHDVQNGVSIGEPNRPEMYVPFAQYPWPQATIAVSTATDPQKIASALAVAVHSLDPNLPLADVKTGEQMVRDQFLGDRSGVVLYGSLAGIALSLASIGIYGVLSFTVAQSTAEIGLRMALGASSSDVLLRVIQQGLTMVALGLILGFAGAYGMSRLMQSILLGTGAMDWYAFSAASALLFVAALIACYVPAQRASAVDPMTALRQG